MANIITKTCMHSSRMRTARLSSCHVVGRECTLLAVHTPCSHTPTKVHAGIHTTPCEQTNMSKNITFPQLRLRTKKINFEKATESVLTAGLGWPPLCHNQHNEQKQETSHFKRNTGIAGDTGPIGSNYLRKEKFDFIYSIEHGVVLTQLWFNSWWMKKLIRQQ